MNKETLNRLALNPDHISPDEARELEDLTRNFPWFSMPWILLTRYYAKSHDYRLDDTLHQTALRVSDRAWLQHFVYPPAPVIQSEEPEMTATETGAPLTENENQYFEPLEEVAVAESGLMIPSVSDEADTLLNMNRLFEIDLEPIYEPEETGLPQDEVFEEIGLFDSTDEKIPSNAEVELPDEDEFIYNQMTDSPILLPDMPEMESTPESEAEVEFFETPIEETEDSEVFEEISSDFLSQLTENAELPVLEETTQIFDEETESSPETFTQTAEPVRVEISYGSGYNIEDYFPAEKTAAPPTDFFSWLSNPGYHQNSGTEEAAPEDTDDLISRFIRTNPGISRPKKEFFNPPEVARKSEQLPDDLASETLANVFLSQQNPAKAIQIYEKLQLKFPEKSPYFAALIEKTKKEHNL